METQLTIYFEDVEETKIWGVRSFREEIVMYQHMEFSALGLRKLISHFLLYNHPEFVYAEYDKGDGNRLQYIYAGEFSVYK